jgi:hypothetical protein
MDETPSNFAFTFNLRRYNESRIRRYSWHEAGPVTAPRFDTA